VVKAMRKFSTRNSNRSKGSICLYRRVPVKTLSV
jgi:hypothetical protein